MARVPRSPRPSPRPVPRARRPFRILAAVGAALLLLFGAATVDAFLLEPADFEIERITVHSPRLPDAWEGRTVVLLSDLHLGAGTYVEDLERVAALADAESPDLVLFLGDAVDSRTPSDPALLERAGAAFAGISARSGKFACIGNHDDRTNPERAMFLAMMDRGGFEVLVDRSAETDGIVVGGLDEAYFGTPDPASVFDGAPEGSFRLLLAHHPWLGMAASTRAAAEPDLVVSGHTHGGQATLFGLPIPFYSGLVGEYAAGLYERGGTTLYVNRGLGTFGIRARFFCRPEITVLTLAR